MTRFFYWILVLLATAQPCAAQIAYDNATHSASQAATSGFSWTHTINSNTNGLVVVGLAIRDPSGSACAVTSVTYPISTIPTNLTQIRLDDNLASPARSCTYLGYILAPDSGSNSVTVTMGHSTGEVIGFAVSLTGVQQSGQPDAQGGTSGTTSVTSMSKAVTVVAANSWIVDIARVGNTPTNFNPTSGTKRDSLVGTNTQGGVSTWGPLSAGSNSDAWTWTTANAAWSLSAASFVPSSGATPCQSRALLHVGC